MSEKIYLETFEKRPGSCPGSVCFSLPFVPILILRLRN